MACCETFPIQLDEFPRYEPLYDIYRRCQFQLDKYINIMYKPCFWILWFEVDYSNEILRTSKPKSQSPSLTRDWDAHPTLLAANQEAAFIALNVRGGIYSSIYIDNYNHMYIYIYLLHKKSSSLLQSTDESYPWRVCLVVSWYLEFPHPKGWRVSRWKPLASWLWWIS